CQPSNHVKPYCSVIQVLLVLFVQYIICIQKYPEIGVYLIACAEIQIRVRVKHLVRGSRCSGGAQIGIAFTDVKQIGRQEQFIPVIVSGRNVEFQGGNVPGTQDEIVFVFIAPQTQVHAESLRVTHVQFRVDRGAFSVLSGIVNLKLPPVERVVDDEILVIHICVFELRLEAYAGRKRAPDAGKDVVFFPGIGQFSKLTHVGVFLGEFPDRILHHIAAYASEQGQVFGDELKIHADVGEKEK